MAKFRTVVGGQGFEIDGTRFQAGLDRIVEVPDALAAKAQALGIGLLLLDAPPAPVEAPSEPTPAPRPRAKK